MSQKSSQEIVLLEAVEALDAVDALDAADWARKHLIAAVVNPAIRYTIWAYHTEALAPSPNLCVDCEDRAGDTFELTDPDDLLDMFEYGEWLDDDTFSPNIHPNCHCLVVRQEDVYW